MGKHAKLGEKVAAIERVRNGESKASVARDVGVSDAVLRLWIKNEDKLREDTDQGGMLGKDAIEVDSQSQPLSISTPTQRTPRRSLASSRSDNVLKTPSTARSCEVVECNKQVTVIDSDTSELLTLRNIIIEKNNEIMSLAEIIDNLNKIINDQSLIMSSLKDNCNCISSDSSVSLLSDYDDSVLENNVSVNINNYEDSAEKVGETVNERINENGERIPVIINAKTQMENTHVRNKQIQLNKDSDVKLNESLVRQRIKFFESGGIEKNLRSCNNEIKCKVLLVSDSHGRGVSTLLSQSLPNCSVSSIVKPGAGMQEVYLDSGKLTKQWNANDWIVVMGGSNDIGWRSKVDIANDMTTLLSELLPLSKDMNVLINTIPLRFDTPYLNNDINYINKHIHATINNIKNKNSSKIYLNFLENKLSRNLYNKNGYHLNRRGKQSLSDSIANFVRRDNGFLESSLIMPKIN